MWWMPVLRSSGSFLKFTLRLRSGRDVYGYRLHVPAFMMLELCNVLAKKIRREELTRHDGDAILKELKHLPLQRHADDRLFPAAYRLALDTHRSLYDCLYLALAEAIDGIMITADRKFYAALADGAYGQRILWVEDLPRSA